MKVLESALIDLAIHLMLLLENHVLRVSGLEGIQKLCPTSASTLICTQYVTPTHAVKSLKGRSTHSQTAQAHIFSFTICTQPCDAQVLHALRPSYNITSTVMHGIKF